jgi:hypothetical protein
MSLMLSGVAVAATAVAGAAGKHACPAGFTGFTGSCCACCIPDVPAMAVCSWVAMFLVLSASSIGVSRMCLLMSSSSSMDPSDVSSFVCSSSKYACAKAIAFSSVGRKTSVLCSSRYCSPRANRCLQGLYLTLYQLPKYWQTCFNFLVTMPCSLSQYTRRSSPLRFSGCSLRQIVTQ